MATTAEDVLTFWFEEVEPAQHWKKDLDFDRMIQQRFGKLLERASQCELFPWRQANTAQGSALGRLAEIIVLDQFSRNIYRDQPQSFQQDALALALAQEAVAQGCLKHLAPPLQAFLLMPYMHSESAAVHEQAVTLFEQYGSEGNLDFERRHKAIIDQFGRYPHRNVILGRPSTQSELEFLQQPGSSF